MSQIHRSPGFITSTLIGKNVNGETIKEFEASHGTASDIWQMHMNGNETSCNPLGLIEALVSSIEFAEHIGEKNQNYLSLPKPANVNTSTLVKVKEQRIFLVKWRDNRRVYI